MHLAHTTPLSLEGPLIQVQFTCKRTFSIRNRCSYTKFQLSFSMIQIKAEQRHLKPLSHSPKSPSTLMEDENQITRISNNTEGHVLHSQYIFLLRKSADYLFLYFLSSHSVGCFVWICPFFGGFLTFFVVLLQRHK